MRDGRWAEVAQSIKNSKGHVYQEEDRVMFWLNLGTAYHYAGDYDQSMAYFAKAEQTMRDLFTTSISGTASKILVTESTQDYPGDDHEKALLYVYTALNRLAQGRTSDALVEARRADELLKEVKVAREKEHEVGTLYGEDAFVLWLVGLLYEEEGSLQDALITYQAAEKNYREVFGPQFRTPAPHYLYDDIWRVASRIGRQDVIDEVKERNVTEGASIEAFNKGYGEVIVIYGLGESPYKKEKFVTAPLPDGYIVRVAIPELVARDNDTTGFRASGGAESVEAELAESVHNVALVSYNHRLPAITGRAVGRAALKYGLTKGASKAAEGGKGKDGKKSKSRSLLGALVGLAGNVTAVATEHADLRSWTMLPARFYVARLWLPPGTHEVTVSGSGTYTVDVKAKHRSFLSLRSIN